MSQARNDWMDEDWADEDRSAGNRPVDNRADDRADDPIFQDAGRHTFDEDAALTPIFHALTRGGWRGRQHEPAAAHREDPATAFDEDPLGAPIPAPVSVAGGRAARRRAASEQALPDVTPGRHHRGFERVASPQRG